MHSSIVFVIDKNPIHNSLIKYHLNINRFSQVHTFQSWSECHYRLEKNLIPDYLITDYDSGDISGFDLLRKIQAMAPSTRVVFFSSYDDPILAIRLLDAGASDYIIKTSRLEIGLTELVKNVSYLNKEELLARKG